MNTTYTRKQVEVILEAMVDDLIKSSNKAYEEIDSVSSLVPVGDGWEIEFSMWLLARKVGGGIDQQQPPIGMKTLKLHITASTKTDFYNEEEDLIAGEFAPIADQKLKAEKSIDAGSKNIITNAAWEPIIKELCKVEARGGNAFRIWDLVRSLPEEHRR